MKFRTTITALMVVGMSVPAAAAERVTDGLLALYTFQRPDGNVIRDRSGVGKPLDLEIENPKAVAWQDGRMAVNSPTKIASSQPAGKIARAIQRSKELSIEVWLAPADARQTGPARIVTLSANPNLRNFTLGQDGDKYDVRLRTTRTSTNGIPSLSARGKTAATSLTHVVYTHARSGATRIYVNGKQNVERKVTGDTANWEGKFRLALANELTNDRPWKGAFWLVAVYGRDLSPAEVQQNFKAGAGVITSPEAIARRDHRAALQFFDSRVAPVLAEHCLQCHDSAAKKGGLDLSRKKAALAGGDSGRVIVPGKSAESLLWEAVESNEMPKDRAPLSSEEKALLRKWIDDGAAWSSDFIDPAVYAHRGAAGGVWVQRLTVTEYIETVRSAVGVDIGPQARELLPPDVRADGFSNTAYNLNVDLKHVDAYARLAEMIVEKMDVKAYAGRYTKNRQLTDNNLRALIAKMGKWLLRGPLSEREIVVYRGISTTVAAAGGDFEEAVSCTIEAMLQSPRFIYRIENQPAGGAAQAVGDYELASRLSYILWGGPPDRELMRAADAGELRDSAALEKQVRRMLDDPRAIERSVRFIDEWLNLGRLANLRPDPKKFPDWKPELAGDMRAETLAFFKEIAWKQKRPLAELLNAPLTYATPRLARHYGFKPQGKGNGLSRYDLSSVSARGGLLTQGSVLTLGGDDASTVSRGLFVLHDLLRGTVNAPPPCVDTTPVPTKPGLTQRGIAEARIANVNCGICHAKFEPLAFGLEKFDGLGTFHEKDRFGNKLREDGEMLIPGAANPVEYKTAAQLMDLLASSDRVRETITWKIAQFAMGRPLAAADAASVAKVHETAVKNGGTYAAVITALVMSDLVRKTHP